MRFLVDECSGPKVAQWLKNLNHVVISAYEEFKGYEDEALLKIAYENNCILITNDKDFGELIYRQNFPHHGIILLRLDDERPVNKIKILSKIIEKYASSLENHFIVATEKMIRIV